MKKLFSLVLLLVSINVLHARNLFADPYASGDYVSVATGTWATLATWKVYNGTDLASSPVATAVPSATTNVWVDGGFTVTVGAAGNAKDLHVINGVLKTGKSCTGNNTNAGIIKINGTLVDVTTGGTIGSGPNALLEDSADAISLQAVNVGVTTVTGTGGNIDVSKFIIGNSSTSTAGTVIIDHDITVHYHGSAFAGNAFGLYPVGTSTGNVFTLTINPGKTVTMARWSSLGATSSSHGAPTTTFTVNVNGSLTFVPGRPVSDTATYGFPASGTSGNGYLTLGVNSANLFTLNIGGTGVVTVPEFYPNSTAVAGTPGPGAVASITIAAGGVLNIDSIADFRKAAQIITGGGTVNIRAGALMKIGSHTGIAASGATGHIQTTTRNFSTAASYAYVDTAVQVTGDGLPATVKNLTISNTLGTTLSRHLLNVTGKLTLGNGNFIINTGDSVVVKQGGSLLSGAFYGYVETKVNASTGSKAVLGIEGITSGSITLFPVGTNGYYLPVTVTPDTISNFYVTSFNGATSDGTLTGPTLNTSQKDISADALYLINRTLPTTARSYTLQLGFSQYKLGGTTFRTYNPAQFGISNYNGGWSAAIANIGVLTDTTSTTANVTTKGSFYVTSATTLPVKFTSVGALLIGGNSSKITWTIGGETNISSYVIEKSADGISFNVIGNVTANGSALYSFVDANTIDAVNYYRVKSVEKGTGNSFYTALAVVRKSGIKNAGIAIYPNPVKNNQFNLQLNNLQTGKVIISLYNNDGKQVMTKSVDYTGGNVTQTIQLPNAKSGIYTLYVNDGSATFNRLMYIAK